MSATAFAGKITFVSWGGSYTASQVKACIEPYEAKTGQQFNIVDYNGGLAEVRTQVEAGNVQWDIVDMTPQDSLRGCDEGLLVELDHSQWLPAPDGTPATEDFVDGALADCHWVIFPGQLYLPITKRPLRRRKASTVCRQA
jgi:putative spermidine/putrescine transport system substrate-binding protein